MRFVTADERLVRAARTRFPDGLAGLVVPLSALDEAL
jgi:hypothetical protein